tara:strand:+ start:151 stop:666 length:516 start_codon:yes stop_codon:yes gene_type:complete
MLAEAERLSPEVRVARTRMSPVDTLGGILGEFVLAQWLTGDWQNHEVGKNKGRADLFGLIEVKTSIFPFRENLNLVVREDYGDKFKEVYVQNIIDVESRDNKTIKPGTRAVICGFATHDQATSKPPREMNMGWRSTPYKAFQTPISELQPMAGFQEFLRKVAAEKGVNLDF